MSERTNTRQFFDRIARSYYGESYEKPNDRHAHNLSLRRNVCLQLMPEDSGGFCLDLGCGPGAMTIPLVQAGRRVIATDISVEMVAEASRRVEALGKTAVVAVADATALPFEDGSFSTVVSTGVLEYIPELQQALSEVARVLEAGGTFIGTMSLPRRFERLAVTAWRRLRLRNSETKQFIYGRREFDQLVESAGLTIEVRRCCTFAPFPMDALFPSSVQWIDTTFAKYFNRSEVACDQAKTYIVRARRA